MRSTDGMKQAKQKRFRPRKSYNATRLIQSKGILSDMVRSNAKEARRIGGKLSTNMAGGLTDLTVRHGLSIKAGHLQLLEGRWYVTHAGLLQVATRRRCQGIHTTLKETQCDPVAHRWVFKAIVYRSRGSRGFVGYGDADPSNVSPLVRGAEMRIAETRAVNRALRKAYGIGLCSVEELGWVSDPVKAPDPPRKSNGFQNSNGSNGNPSRLRDRLCLLIRQYNLDPSLVKAYAADFCGTETLKGASREEPDVASGCGRAELPLVRPTKSYPR